MSSTYNLEPNPTAKVVLHTTAGDLELELFAKQTPVTSRNFLQLCLDGYYDNTIFHRLVKGFILQGGDPTGTGQGGESSYDGEPFADEFNSRLKFNRRGLLGMANTGKDDNGSQFFFTLANTPELQGKNTMFGRVVGDTIYNLMKMAEAEIAEGSEDRPLYPTRITSTEIIINPFDDMVKRVRVAERTEPEAKKAKKPKRKAGKTLLSFGGEEGDEADAAPVKKKAKFNTKLVSAGEEPAALDNTPMPKVPEEERAIPIRKSTRKSPVRSASPKPEPASRTKSPPREERRPPPRERSPESEKQSKLERVNAQIAELKASMKRNTATQRAEPAKKKSLLESMVPPTTTRGRKRGAGASNAASEKAALDVLTRFKSKLEAAAPTAKLKTPEMPETENGAQGANDGKAAAGKEEGEEESDDDAGWMAHSLSFAKDRLGKDLEWKRKNEEELVVIDPLEEAKKLKAERRPRREWDDAKGKRKMKT